MKNKEVKYSDAYIIKFTLNDGSNENYIATNLVLGTHDKPNSSTFINECLVGIVGFMRPKPNVFMSPRFIRINVPNNYMDKSEMDKKAIEQALRIYHSDDYFMKSIKEIRSIERY